MIFLNLFKRRKVSFLDEKWVLLKDNVKVCNIPRINELIYLNPKGGYYRVVNVVHKIEETHEIFIIIEKYSDE